MENKHLIAGGGVGLMVLLIVLFFIQSTNSENNSNNFLGDLNLIKKQAQSNPNQANQIKEIKELAIQELKTGTSSAAVVLGDSVKVNYTGMFIDGRKFDSNYGKAPFEIEIGKGAVIKGFEQGIIGMKTGGIRRIFIPANLAYGNQGSGNIIPPNTPLVFDVELIEISKKDSSKQTESPPNPEGPENPPADNMSPNEPTVTESNSEQGAPAEITPTQNPTENPTPSPENP